MTWMILLAKEEILNYAGFHNLVVMKEQNWGKGLELLKTATREDAQGQRIWAKSAKWEAWWEEVRQGGKGFSAWRTGNLREEHQLANFMYKNGGFGILIRYRGAACSCVLKSARKRETEAGLDLVSGCAQHESIWRERSSPQGFPLPARFPRGCSFSGTRLLLRKLQL